MNDDAAGTTLKPLLIAEICHEANAAYCRTLADYSQPAWDDAPEWQRESALAGVQAIIDGRVVEPEDSHNSWLEQKQAEGWTYGAEKDPEKKTHPCMRPFYDLPWEQQRKDCLFLAIVQALTEPL